jgi:hypothetical protein
LSAGRDDEGDNAIDIRLLADINGILVGVKDKAIGSTILVAELAAIEDAPWAKFGKSGKPLTTRRLAMMLRPFGIYAAHQKGGNEYDVAALLDIVARYASSADTSSEDAPQTFIASQTLGAVGETENFKASPQATGEGLKNEETPSLPMGCEAMKVQPPLGDNGAGRDSTRADFEPFEAEPFEAGRSQDEDNQLSEEPDDLPDDDTEVF